MMGKLILYQNRERAIVAVHQYHMGPCDYGPQLRANYEKSNVYVHDTTLRPQNAEQLRENGWLRCRREPQSFNTCDSSEFGVWSLRKSKVYVHDTTLRS